MKSGGALLLVIVGVLALWVVITGRLGALQAAWGTLTTNGAPVASTSGSGGASGIADALTNGLKPLTVPVFDVSHFAVPQA